jgi:hypothetical protein
MMFGRKADSGIVKIVEFFVALLVIAVVGYYLQHMDSVDILIAACKNKSAEIFSSVQLFLAFLVLLSIILFLSERSKNRENFTNLFSGTLWSISKLVDGIAGYGNFQIISTFGKFIATVFGLSKIALFAILAGVIASGFMEEMQNRQKIAVIKQNVDKIVGAFQYEDLTRHRLAKQKYNITGPKRYLSMEDVGIRLYISRDDMIDSVNASGILRLTDYEDEHGDVMIMEHFAKNCIYGIMLNRNSPVTILSTHSGDQPFMGHFTARVADALGANYISNEVYSDSSLREEFRLPILERNSYVTGEKDESPVIERFKQDLAAVVKPGNVLVYFLAAPPVDPEVPMQFFIRYGPEEEYEDSEQATFAAMEKVHAWVKSVQENALKIDLNVAAYSDKDSLEPDGLGPFIHKQLGGEAICIQVSIDILETSDADLYYKSVRMLADAVLQLQYSMK